MFLHHKTIDQFHCCSWLFVAALLLGFLFVYTCGWVGFGVGGGGGGGQGVGSFQQIWWKACIGFLFICLYPPTDQCPDVLGFVQHVVSQAPQHFRSSCKVFWVSLSHLKLFLAFTSLSFLLLCLSRSSLICSRSFLKKKGQRKDAQQVNNSTGPSPFTGVS